VLCPHCRHSADQFGALQTNGRNAKAALQHLDGERMTAMGRIAPGARFPMSCKLYDKSSHDPAGQNPTKLEQSAT
jgi:hypothetical protein